MDKSSSLGMSPEHPKKYPRGSSVKAWGCPRHPLFINKKHQVIFQCAIFLLLHALCVILGASLFFMCVYFVCLFNKVGPHHIYFRVRHAPLYCIFTLEWDTLRCTACLFWSETRSAVLHHVYFGLRHAPLFCIMCTLEWDTLHLFCIWML